MKNNVSFIRDLEKEGFQKYIIQNNDEVVMNDGSPYTDQLYARLNKYNVDQTNIATFIFSAISNTQSNKIFFSYDEMKNFISSFSSNKPKHLVKDTKWVLKDLSLIKADSTTLPLLFEEAKVSTDKRVIVIELSPSSSFIFGTVNFRKNKSYKS